jgi:hypothetical protein
MLDIRDVIKKNQRDIGLHRTARAQFRAGRHRWHNNIPIPSDISIAELSRKIAELLAANKGLRSGSFN